MDSNEDDNRRLRRLDHRLIALGGASDGANALKAFGAREESLPFDWLWNLDAGLGAVSEMVAQDFAQILPADSYVTAFHDKFGHPMVVYRAFPTIAHVHSNPLRHPQEHDKLVRRIHRLRESLMAADVIDFVYYRCFEEDRRRDPQVGLDDSMDRLLTESEVFMNVVLSKYPARTADSIRLLSVLQANPEYEESATRLVRRMASAKSNIQMGYTVTRNDDDRDLIQVFARQWRQLLLARIDLTMAEQFLESTLPIRGDSLRIP